MHRHLGAAVQRQRWAKLMNPRHHADILNDHAVDAAVGQNLDIPIQRRKFPIQGHGIDRHVALCAVQAAVFGGRLDLFFRKVVRKAARTKLLAGKIDRVRAALHRRF